MQTVILEPLSSFAERTINHFGNEWVINNDNDSYFVLSDLDESTTKAVHKTHDDHFKIINI